MNEDLHGKERGNNNDARNNIASDNPGDDASPKANNDTGDTNQNPDPGTGTEHADRVAYLIAAYLKNTLTDDEREELDEWVTASDANMQLFVRLINEKTLEKGLKERKLYDADRAVKRLQEEIRRKRRQAKRIRLGATLAVAAGVILLVAIYLVPALNSKKPGKTIEQVTTADLPPGGNKAILTTGNGKHITLDNSKTSLLNETGLNIENQSGVLSYEGTDNQALNTHSLFHTLSTPVGGQYQLILPDGSRVWLNASSSIKFPTAFTQEQRLVDISGEAYFEVAHNPVKPFVVKNGTNEITVLGTHFNVNAYSDEAATKVTLLQGSVKVSNDKGALTIKPGQQAMLTLNHPPEAASSVDIEEIIAWKNGLFQFNDEPIEIIMRQVARWYGVKPVYQGRIPYHFTVDIERNLPLSKVLHLLELNNNVHFTLQDKTLIVKP
jgi:transmembrane sensor